VGEVYIEPIEMAGNCFKQIDSSDLVIAYPEKSRGVHIELGWAASRGKKIIVLMKNGEKTSSMISGLESVTDAMIIRFKDNKDLQKQLHNVLNLI
jgi:nucleoside 2-deoxyribosyltransferase